jgi:ubiquitin C-terminal hydrolase
MAMVVYLEQVGVYYNRSDKLLLGIVLARIVINAHSRNVSKNLQVMHHNHTGLQYLKPFFLTGEEILDGDDMIQCELCKMKRKCVKRLSIFRYPKILVSQNTLFDGIVLV